MACVVVASAVLEGVLGWHLTGVGNGLAPPVFKVWVVGAALFGIGWAGLENLRGLNAGVQPSHRTFRLFTCCCAVVALAAGAFTWAFVQPLQVRSWDGELTKLMLCSEKETAGCPRTATVDVPGLGAVPRSSFYFQVSPDYGSITVDPDSDFGARGYYYQPGATPGTLDVNNTCIRHVYGPWWEFGFGDEGNCPFSGYRQMLGP
ncbi:MAG: hypothetical protein ACLQNG_11940 [Acidimicrobiales bacterium]|jgi:hypothetical protein